MLSPNLTCFQQEGYKLIYINGIKLGKFIHPVGIIGKDLLSSPEKEASSGMLEEVVVTDMVATNKRLFTGAADKLSASDVKIDGMADISRGLEGRSAGVSIQNISGAFGAAPKKRVHSRTESRRHRKLPDSERRIRHIHL